MSFFDASDPECRPDESASSIDLHLEPKISDIGAFQVRRTLPSHKRRTVGPFIFFDHMGPVEFPPGRSIDVLPHPHIGLATVTYLFEGEILHRDSVGSLQLIEPGAINWMVAGSGIVHSERSRPEVQAAGQRLHGIQLWVALPEGKEDGDPAFYHHPASDFRDTVLEANGGQVQFRLLMGEALGQRSPVEVLSPMIYGELKVPENVTYTLPVLASEQAIYIAEGEILAEGKEYGDGSMLVLAPDRTLTLRALKSARIMILGGDPIGKRKIYWNFVHSNPEKIEEAKQRWADQKFPAIEGETEFVPLPPQKR
jgi:redox-sensitive bicupin YhaK (pirin superfamily)